MARSCSEVLGCCLPLQESEHFSPELLLLFRMQGLQSLHSGRRALFTRIIIIIPNAGTRHPLCALTRRGKSSARGVYKVRIPRRFRPCDAQGWPVGMQSYSRFSTPTAGTMPPMSVPDDSPDNAIKDRVKVAEAKAAVKTLLKHVNSLDEFAVNTYQKADSAIFDVRGEISNLYHLINMLDDRVITLESGNEKKGAWSALCAARIDAHT